MIVHFRRETIFFNIQKTYTMARYRRGYGGKRRGGRTKRQKTYFVARGGIRL